MITLKYKALSSMPVTVHLAVNIWLRTSLYLWILAIVCLSFFDGDGAGLVCLLGFPVSLVFSLPALLMLFVLLSFIKQTTYQVKEKMQLLYISVLLICFIYGLATDLILNGRDNEITDYFGVIISIVLAVPALLACVVGRQKALLFFDHCHHPDDSLRTTSTGTIDVPVPLNNKNNTNMDTNQPLPEAANARANKILVKGVITGVLILVMLIPTIFITNLVKEREERQGQVVTEVSSKWASAQTLIGPYILIPYIESFKNNEGKQVDVRKWATIIPDDVTVTGDVEPQERRRSIYNVLLYRSNLNGNGVFNIQLPQEFDINSLRLQEAKICMSLNDFKGIEEKVTMNFNGKPYELSPGLPEGAEGSGLSGSLALSAADFDATLPFSFNLKLKGSQQLSFVPLSGNSKFSLRSKWPSPSFDGITLPNERNVNDSGFSASWSFNKANLPFRTFMADFKFNLQEYSFGVTMLQPADQYAKTMRSVKYAILFIGLTFSLFFIIELMQNKPVHPVQYVLVGIALVIFYSLLLSFSEFIQFDIAYLVAAAATVSLITLYAKGHFKKWSIASLFGIVLSMLYGFIYVLIMLEDTSLLVGSIGLFAVLAMVMYASRKVNWYNPTFENTNVKSA